ncbi:glycoside hydrolase family 13 protein [Luteimicrobium sp. DT211]|uniref:glycoside hydrolase family 13 protein n=1 Tax=Luteimicrobium sp. DT211 TaxID=3393412 RepID=UPI003CEA4419
MSSWWKSAVVYQIYPRSFADSNGDGVGDLPGVESRLDHLSDLGVDVVWLSPVYVSPQADNGYDIADYQAIDPMFGTLDDFDRLLAAVHERGIKLVMDLVVNHTSDEHPWFVSSRDGGPDGPHREWYWWHPPREGFAAGSPGAEPTNWESFFSGPAWMLDEASGEYYLHLFDRKQPDLNWENPQVRHAVYAMMRWWLDRGVDGFRMDVINLVSKVLPLRDGAPNGHGALGDGSPLYTTGPRVHEYLQEMHREVFDRYPGRELLTVGETPGVTLEEAIAFTDPNRREVDMVFQFEHVGLDHGPSGKFDPVPLDLLDLKASLGRWQAGLGSVGWNSLYWDNHDQPRVVSRFGDDGRYWRESATALATLLHLHRGTPYVYQGEELGMTNAPFASIADVQDVEALGFYGQQVAFGHDPEVLLEGIRAMGRDNARTPVQWSAGPGAGFTTGTPWLAVNPNATWLNADAQRDDPESVLSHYRRLIALRHAEPVVADGDFTMLVPDHPHVYAYARELDGDRLVVVVNVSSDEQEVALADLVPPGAALGDVVLANLPPVGGEGTTPTPDPGAVVRLRPWEARVNLSR